MTRKSLLLLVCVLFASSVFADYYYYEGKKLMLTPIEGKQSKIKLNVNEPTLDTKFLSGSKIVKNTATSYNAVSDVAVVKSQLKSSQAETVNANAPINDELCFNAVVNANGIEAYLNNFIFVKLKNEADTKILADVIKKYNLLYVEQNEDMPLWHTLSITTQTKMSSLEVANAIYETGKVEAAEPDFVYTGENAIIGTGDIIVIPTGPTDEPKYNEQWGLHFFGSRTDMVGNTKYNYGVNVEDAWKSVTGKGVKVAVFDTGVVTEHSDLKANIYGTGFDCTNNCAPAVSPNVRAGDQDWLHGTRAASIIAAPINKIGMAGVAPDAKIIPISINFSKKIQTNQHFVNGFNWATNSDVDVINCSWGTSSAIESQILKDAIARCLKNGRGGKGCVVVFSSGNNGFNFLPFPANCHDDIIVVGASDNNGVRADFSNYGPGLDVVAPGVGILCAGYESTYICPQSEQYDEVDGTSFAAPIVSGIAALVLERNPDLTQKQVHDVITTSTNKLSSYTYTNCKDYHSHAEGNNYAKWNVETGHGVVDASVATMDAVKTPQKIEGRTIMLNSGEFEYRLDRPALRVNWSLVDPSSHIEIVSDPSPNANSRQPFILKSATGEPTTETIRAEVLTQSRNIYVFEKTIYTNGALTNTMDGTIYQPSCFAYNRCYPEISKRFTNLTNLRIYEGCQAEIEFTKETALGWDCKFENGTIPISWHYNKADRTLTIALPQNSYGTPSSFEMTSPDGEKKRFNVWAMQYSTPAAMNVGVSPGTLTVELAQENLLATDITESDEMDVTVFNIQTGETHKQTVKNRSCRFNTETWEKGFYIVQTQIGNTIIENKTIIE